MDFLSQLLGVYFLWSIIVMAFPEVIPEQDGTKTKAMWSLFVSGIFGIFVFVFVFTPKILFEKYTNSK